MRKYTKSYWSEVIKLVGQMYIAFNLGVVISMQCAMLGAGLFVNGFQFTSMFIGWFLFWFYVDGVIFCLMFSAATHIISRNINERNFYGQGQE